MMPPRWRKVLRDAWRTKARTLLVVLSISIGVIGVGLIGQAVAVLTRGMADSKVESHSSAATLFIQAFDESLLNDVKKLPDIGDAAARTEIRTRINPDGGEPAPDQWKTLQLIALPDYSDIRMDRIFPVSGAWPADEGEIALEKLTADYLNVRIGDNVSVETPDGKLHRMRVGGTVRDPGRETTTLSGLSLGYITTSTLETLGLPRSYNALSIGVKGESTDESAVAKAAAQARDAVTAKGMSVVSTLTPDPKKHWGYDIVTSMASILQSLGTLALLMGTCLVVNTVLAIMAGQLRQIGVMKTIGATPGALIRLYVGAVLIYCMLALLFGLPLGLWSARALTNQSTVLLNFDSSGYRLSPVVISLQVSVGLIVPLLAALYPIVNGTRISVREAIGGQGSGGGRPGKLVEKVRGLPRPLLLSLRNTFRRKGRLLLTLATLSLGGAIVVAVISVHASMNLSLDNSLKYANYDVRISLDRPVSVDTLNRTALSIPHVEKAETWGIRNANRVKPGGGESEDFLIAAPPAGSTMILPTITEGRWLQPGDERALVLDTYLLRKEPDLRVGDSIVLKIGGNETSWHIVGFARKLVGEVVCYVNESALAQATGTMGQGSLLHVVTDGHDRSVQAEAESELKARLKEQGIGVSSTLLTTELRDVAKARINIVIAFLIMMAVLLTIVSGLGLMGTMSLNVLERTREIGVLRSIGASDRSIWGIVVAEGVIIGLISWVVGSLLAYPVSIQICASIGKSLFSAPLDFQFPLIGIVVWLAAGIGLSALASFAPAWNAARLSVREVLNYE